MTDDAARPGSGARGERWIRMERRLDASIERVYRAWSDPEELGRWLAPQVEGGLAVGARTWLVGTSARVWWDVVDTHANTRFEFDRAWLPDDRVITRTVITLELVGYGTRVHVQDGPFDLDDPDGHEAWERAIAFWAEALVMLRAYLDFSVDVRPKR